MSLKDWLEIRTISLLRSHIYRLVFWFPSLFHLDYLTNLPLWPNFFNPSGGLIEDFTTCIYKQGRKENSFQIKKLIGSFYLQSTRIHILANWCTLQELWQTAVGLGMEALNRRQLDMLCGTYPKMADHKICYCESLTIHERFILLFLFANSVPHRFLISPTGEAQISNFKHLTMDRIFRTYKESEINKSLVVSELRYTIHLI